MIFALIILDVCLLLAHLCEGIDWLFYPLAIIEIFCIFVAFDSYENLKKRVEKLEKKGGADNERETAD